MDHGSRAGLNRTRNSTQTAQKQEYQNGQYGMQGTMGTTPSGSGTRCVSAASRISLQPLTSFPSLPSCKPTRISALHSHLGAHSAYHPSNSQPQRTLNSTQSWAHAQSQMVIKQEPSSSASQTSQKPALTTAANGARSEPPKRAIEIEQLSIGTPDVGELVRTAG